MVECTPIKVCISCTPIKGLVTNLLAHHPLSSLAYPMIIHTPLVAGNLTIKTLVAR
jgi:hypothetical protein